MARKGGVFENKDAQLVFESSMGVYNSVVAVGTSAVAIPTTNLSYRKGLIIQNIHASQNLYLGGSPQEFIIANFRLNKESGAVGEIYPLQWKKSAGGTNEWYAVSLSNGDPGITEPLVVYYATVGGGTETLATNGTVASLTANQWDYGDGDTLGFNTVYVRTGGSTPAYSPALVYDFLLSYTRMPDTSSNYGFLLRSYESLYLPLDGSTRIFGIGSGAGTTTTVLEIL